MRDLFLTHTHFDHICGFPFFSTAFDPRNTYRMWAGHLHPERNLRDLPVCIDERPGLSGPGRDHEGGYELPRFRPGRCAGAASRNPDPHRPAQPPATGGGATGSNSTAAPSATSPIPSTRPRASIRVSPSWWPVPTSWSTTPCSPMRNIRAGSAGGHSTWSAGMRLAEEAGVKTYVVFHHDPAHDDEQMDRIARRGRRTPARHGGRRVRAWCWSPEPCPHPRPLPSGLALGSMLGREPE